MSRMTNYLSVFDIPNSQARSLNSVTVHGKNGRIRVKVGDFVLMSWGPYFPVPIVSLSQSDDGRRMLVRECLDSLSSCSLFRVDAHVWYQKVPRREALTHPATQRLVKLCDPKYRERERKVSPTKAILLEAKPRIKRWGFVEFCLYMDEWYVRRSGTWFHILPR